ncbi:MAG TPA: hypothetical protein VFZ77_25020 [Acidimicrobiales bacterium]
MPDSLATPPAAPSHPPGDPDMTLPPDPHDDDLAEPDAPPAAGDAAAGEAALAAGGQPAPDESVPVPVLEPPPSPAYTARTSPVVPVVPVAASGRPAPAGRADPVVGAAEPGRATGATARAGGGRSGGRGRLGLMLAGVVVVIAVAAAVVITGEDGERGEAPAASEPVPGEGAGPAAGEEPPEDAEGGAGDAPSGAGESPVDVAEAFFAAAVAGDCAGMIDRMTPESYGAGRQTAAAAVAECEADGRGIAAVAAAEFGDIVLVSQQGDDAVVRVAVTAGGTTTTRELPLRLVDGRWLMNLDTSLAAPAA